MSVRTFHLILFALVGVPAFAQSSMPAMNMVEMNAASMDLMNFSSGTSVNPDSWPMPMIMTHFGSWNTMFMGKGFLVDTQQSGPRGGDKLYSTNWFMASAEHRVGPERRVPDRSDAEPGAGHHHRIAAIRCCSKPAKPPTASPFVDGQHPHNFIMGLGVPLRSGAGRKHHGSSSTSRRWAIRRSARWLIRIAPPPRNCRKRPLSHHWQDSTHIADDVVTVGLAYKKFKLEASGFHGAEPGENRWIIQQGAIDSWSSRLWFFPAQELGGASFGGKTHASGSAASRAIRSAPRLPSNTRNPCRAEAGHPA